MLGDILKKFKSVFIVEDESGSSENTSTPPTNAQQHPAEMTAPPSRQRSPEPAPASATIATTGSASDKFVEILAAALGKNAEAQGQDGWQAAVHSKQLAHQHSLMRKQRCQAVSCGLFRHLFCPVLENAVQCWQD